MIALALLFAAADWPGTSVSRVTTQDIADCTAANAQPLAPCAAYILGVADQLSAAHRFCLNSARYDEVVIETVRGFVENYPNAERFGPSFLISEALPSAFPCKKATRRIK